jgi:WD40 repeat protein
LGKGGGELFVWNTASGERLHAIAGHPVNVHAVAWGSQAGIVISGDSEGTLRWWNLQRGDCLRVQKAHEGSVQSLRRSPDGTKLASCGDDGAIVLWDLHSGDHLQTLRRDRPYERMDITGVTGLTTAQVASLKALGAVETLGRVPPGRDQQRSSPNHEPADPEDAGG